MLIVVNVACGMFHEHAGITHLADVAVGILPSYRVFRFSFWFRVQRVRKNAKQKKDG